MRGNDEHLKEIVLGDELGDIGDELGDIAVKANGSGSR